MKHFMKMIAVLLMAALLLPAAGLGEEGGEQVNALDTLRVLMEMEISEGIQPVQGESVYDEVTEDTDPGVVCLIIFGEGEDDSNNSILISGINGQGQYEIRMYSDLDLSHMIYYTYLANAAYNMIQGELPAGAAYSIMISYGEGENDVVLVDSEEKAVSMTETLREAIEGTPAE